MMKYERGNLGFIGEFGFCRRLVFGLVVTIPRQCSGVDITSLGILHIYVGALLRELLDS